MIIIKLVPEKLKLARRKPMIQKWRASNRNGTLISNPTLAEMRVMHAYQKVCSAYINLLLSEIIKKEVSIDEDLDLKPSEYYYKRYDVTAVECKILMNEIYSRL